MPWMRDDLIDQAVQLYVRIRWLRCTTSRWAACPLARSVRARRKRGTAGESDGEGLFDFSRIQPSSATLPTTQFDWLFFWTLAAQTHCLACKKLLPAMATTLWHRSKHLLRLPGQAWGWLVLHEHTSCSDLLLLWWALGTAEKEEGLLPARRCCIPSIFAWPFTPTQLAETEAFSRSGFWLFLTMSAALLFRPPKGSRNAEVLHWRRSRNHERARMFWSLVLMWRGRPWQSLDSLRHPLSSSECALTIFFDLLAVRTFRHCGKCWARAFRGLKRTGIWGKCQCVTAEASCSKVAFEVGNTTNNLKIHGNLSCADWNARVGTQRRNQVARSCFKLMHNAQIAAAHARRGMLFNKCKSALMLKSWRQVSVVYYHWDIFVRLNERRWNLNPSWNSGMTSFSVLLKQRATINEKDDRAWNRYLLTCVGHSVPKLRRHMPSRAPLFISKLQDEISYRIAHVGERMRGCARHRRTNLCGDQCRISWCSGEGWLTPASSGPLWCACKSRGTWSWTWQHHVGVFWISASRSKLGHRHGDFCHRRLFMVGLSRWDDGT